MFSRDTVIPCTSLWEANRVADHYRSQGHQVRIQSVNAWTHNVIISKNSLNSSII